MGEGEGGVKVLMVVVEVVVLWQARKCSHPNFGIVLLGAVVCSCLAACGWLWQHAGLVAESASWRVFAAVVVVAEDVAAALAVAAAKTVAVALAVVVVLAVEVAYAVVG